MPGRAALAWQRGFTLIEIMVVVVIIGLLAAIVAPAVIGRIDTASINRARQDVRTIETAINLYRLDNLAYPTMDEGLQALVSPAGAGAQSYLPRLPVDPWNRPYLYQIPGQRGGDFDVFTYGADGQEGGEETDADIGNWNLQ
jgi:general secretion pathway protein G